MENAFTLSFLIKDGEAGLEPSAVGAANGVPKVAGHLAVSVRV